MRWMRRALPIILLLVACNKETASHAAHLATTARDASGGTTPSPSQAAPQESVRMIVRNATIALVVRDAGDVLRKVSALIDAKGGYLAESKQWKENQQLRATATFRVPSNQLFAVLAAMRPLAVRVESEDVSAEDVSQEYSDAGAQLKNLQATEVELRELLRTVRERTQKASEIMEIYNELTKVRGDIDRIQGRMQYLAQQTALSTLKVELTPDALAAPVVEPGWQPLATVREASRSLVNTMKSLIDALIWVILYMVPIGLVFVGLALLVRAVWRRVKKPNAVTTP